MIKHLHAQLISGELSARDLAESYLQAMAREDGHIKAYLTTFEETALEQARRTDERIARGEEIDILAGIPGAIKDNICVSGTRTTAASKMLDNYIAPFDATAVARLRESGAVFLGKTNLDEFAMGSSTESSAYQKTVNPASAEHVPGGSSGGSAAAVAGEMAVWSIGSDTGGSIRQPAAFCGLVGLKPTYGRVSRYGLIAMASSLDQIGPFATSVEDAAIVFSRMAGADVYDATAAELPRGKSHEEYLSRPVEKLRIGIPKEYWSDSLDPRVRQACEAALEHFRSLGMETVEISLPHSHLALPIYYILMPSEVSSNLARFDGIRYGMSVNDQADSVKRSDSLLETYLDSRRYGLGPEVKRRIMLGTYALSAGYYDAYYKKAERVRGLIRKDFEEAFQKVDLIFSPTTPGPAFRFGEKTSDPLSMYLSDVYTVTANLAGLPAISLPIGHVLEGDKSLPLGGQLMGKWFDEETLLSASHAFEQSFSVENGSAQIKMPAH